MDRVFVPIVEHPVAGARLLWSQVDLYLSGRFHIYVKLGWHVEEALIAANRDLDNALGLEV